MGLVILPQWGQFLHPSNIVAMFLQVLGPDDANACLIFASVSNELYCGCPSDNLCVISSPPGSLDVTEIIAYHSYSLIIAGLTLQCCKNPHSCSTASASGVGYVFSTASVSTSTVASSTPEILIMSHGIGLMSPYITSAILVGLSFFLFSVQGKRSILASSNTVGSMSPLIFLVLRPASILEQMTP